MIFRRRHALAPTIVAALVIAPLAFTAPAAADGEVTSPRGNAVLWRASFNDLTDDVQRNGYTHVPPDGWNVAIDPAMSGAGVETWRGWTFTTREFWVDAEDQMRHRFGRSDGVIAVADSDEYADSDDAPEVFDTTLTSAPVRVRGHDRLELTFDSHLRSWPGQVASVTVEFDDSGDEVPLLRYDDTNTTGDYDPARANVSVSPSTPRNHRSCAAAAMSSSPSVIVAKTLPGTQPASPLIRRLLRP